MKKILKNGSLLIFSFYIKGTNEFVIRYVIGKDEKENKFILEECRNKPLKIEEIFPDIK